MPTTRTGGSKSYVTLTSIISWLKLDPISQCLDKNESIAGACTGFKWRDDIPKGPAPKVNPPEGRKRAPGKNCPGLVCSGTGSVNKECICGVCKKDCKALRLDHGYRGVCRVGDHQGDYGAVSQTQPGQAPVPAKPVTFSGQYLSTLYEVQYDSIRSEQHMREQLHAASQQRMPGRTLTVYWWAKVCAPTSYNLTAERSMQQDEEAEVMEAMLAPGTKTFHPKEHELVAAVTGITAQRCKFYKESIRHWIQYSASSPPVEVNQISALYFRALDVTAGLPTAGRQMPQSSNTISAVEDDTHTPVNIRKRSASPLDAIAALALKTPSPKKVQPSTVICSRNTHCFCQARPSVGGSSVNPIEIEDSDDDDDDDIAIGGGAIMRIKAEPHPVTSILCVLKVSITLVRFSSPSLFSSAGTKGARGQGWPLYYYTDMATGFEKFNTLVRASTSNPDAFAAAFAPFKYKPSTFFMHKAVWDAATTAQKETFQSQPLATWAAFRREAKGGRTK